ncbi:MAG: HD domain-containing phosphohydrolase [Rubrivivax sp.]
MTLTARQAAFGTANPHALATILEASETRHIIAATDIFDISGIKLWARDQPVSASLQRRLMDRQLREPMESCLVAEDGVTVMTLVLALQKLVEGHSALAPLIKPHAARLAHEVAHLPLHPVAQLLLTAGQTTRPQAFDHAVAAMALCGALCAGQGGGTPEIRLAMLCGLLHDLGEFYIDPRHGEAEADRDLDFVSYQQLVVHPHVGQLLIGQLTHYPAAVARAVAEHHERLDGSGYPHALRVDALSPLGRMLAVAEAALGAVRGEGTALLRASVALRAVPGEFDLGWAGLISRAANGGAAASVMEPEDIVSRLYALSLVLEQAEAAVRRHQAGVTHPGLRDALALAAHLIGRLRTGWNESGLWNPQALDQGDAAEVEAMEDELYFRLRGIQRVTLLRAGELPAPEAAALAELVDSLAMGAG